MSASSEAQRTGAGCLTRSVWMLGGNVLLAYLLFSVVHNPARPLTGTAIAYAATIAAMILVRYLDIRFLSGETADGQPATMKHWRSYSIILVVVSLAMWALAAILSRG